MTSLRSALVIVAVSGCCSRQELVSLPRFSRTGTPAPEVELGAREEATAYSDPQGLFALYPVAGDSSRYYLAPSTLHVLKGPTGNPVGTTIVDRVALNAVILIGTARSTFEEARKAVTVNFPGATVTSLPIQDAEVSPISPLPDGVTAHFMDVMETGPGWVGAIWFRATDEDGRRAIQAGLLTDSGFSIEIRYRARVLVSSTNTVELRTESISCSIGGLALAPDRLP